MESMKQKTWPSGRGALMLLPRNEPQTLVFQFEGGKGASCACWATNDALSGDCWQRQKCPSCAKLEVTKTQLKVTYYSKSTFSCLVYISMCPFCVQRFPLFVLIHLYKNLSENELIRFWPLYDITIFWLTKVTNPTPPPPPLPLCVLFNQISLRGAWGVAPYFHLKRISTFETEGIMGCYNARSVWYLEQNTSETCFVYICDLYYIDKNGEEKCWFPPVFLTDIPFVYRVYEFTLY